MTLNYMSGVWIAAFIVGGSLLYGKAEKQGPLLVTVLAGFGGVVLTLRPTIDHDQLFAGVVGLLSGIGSALAYMQVTALGKAGETEERTVFYFSVGTTLVGAVGMLLTPTTPWSEVRWQDAAWVIPIGVLASLGQWSMTRAYSQGSTLVVASMQYSGIVFASIFSLTLFGDHIAPMGWLGIAVIVASGVAATALRARTLPDTPAEDH
jgi:S-adenosylmethionine uptake transporter